MNQEFQSNEDWLLEDAIDEKRRFRASRCGWMLSTRRGRMNAGQPLVIARRCGVVEYCDHCRNVAASAEEARAGRVLDEEDEFYMTVLPSEAHYLAFRQRVKRAGGEVRRYPVRDNAITCLFTAEDAVRDEKYQVVRDARQIEWHCLVMLPPGKNKSGSFGKEIKEEVDVGPTVTIVKERYTPRGLTRAQLIEAFDKAAQDVAHMEIDLTSQEEVQIFYEALIHADKSRICELGGRIVNSHTQNCVVWISQLRLTREEWKIRSSCAREFVPERSRGVDLDTLLADSDPPLDIFDT